MRARRRTISAQPQVQWLTNIGSAEKEVLDDALHRVRSFQDDSKQYVRQNPTKAVFTALAVGFVLGLIFRR